ncbi:SDR family oxidoreductase [Enemella sp. A6]|uniref:SDR family oxidoreductase n=1 Tax=Enemella sp. A6 TaxID=3440152 RepID=UPI003EBFDAF3
MSVAMHLCPPDLIRVSRELGHDPDVVLHGGGNTSHKTTTTDIDGRSIEVMWMKASGSDLATVTASGFAPLRLERLRQLLPPTVVPDDLLVNELRCALLQADAPDPSIESLLHAAFPEPWVLHSHPDLLLSITHSPQAAQRLAALDERVAVVDYAMPGPDLVAVISTVLAEQHPDAVIVLNHGIFVAGNTADEALARHNSILETLARDLPEQSPVTHPAALNPDPRALAELRRDVAELAGRPLIAKVQADPQIAAWLQDEDLLAATQAGPLTPDHVTWTKPWPLLGRDIAGFAERYRGYVDANRGRRTREFVELDPAPRVVIDPELGLVTFGRTPAEAGAAGDIARHTLGAIERAQGLGGYLPVGDDHVFDLEYWTLQQQKAARRRLPSKAGRVALVTGAASGIGRACARALLDDGAAVIGWDLNPDVVDAFDEPGWFGHRVDVTDEAAVIAALDEAVLRFGGLDIIVVAAGVFPSAADLGDLDLATWRKVMAVNVDAVTALFTHAAGLLALAADHGHVVVIASKNVVAPGPGAAAYSASKAALTQLSRVAALEWASAGVRVNLLHPDAVFDTGLWSPELLQARASHYGMSVEEYKRRNLLRTEITSMDVGRLAAAMAGPLFDCTTGAQVPIDGGSDRII